MTDEIPPKLQNICQDVFGDYMKALHWLHSPNLSLGGVTPISLLNTQEGTQLVIDALVRLKYGVYV